LFIQYKLSLIVTATSVVIILSSNALPQEEFVRRLNWIPVSDGSGDLTNIYAG